MKPVRNLIRVRATWALLLCAAMVLPVAPAGADSNDPVVWVDKSVSLKGRRISSLQAAANESKYDIPDATLAEIRRALESALRGKGLLDEPRPSGPSSGSLRLRTAVLSFKTGSAAGRWVGFGEGAAKCTIRVQLLEEGSSRSVADVVQSRIVDRGGFFTVGVDDSIHRELAAELAEVLERLLRGGG